MLNYKKGKNIEQELTKESIPIDNLPENFLWMHVNGGTKISNVLNFANAALKNGDYRSVVWSGSGGGVTKTISCAEIMKGDFNLHQITSLCYRQVEEFWEPQMDGLEEIVATRKIPCVHILLSLDEIDKMTPSYQLSRVKSKFWEEHANKKPYRKPVITGDNNREQEPSTSRGGNNNNYRAANFRQKRKPKSTN